MPQIPTLINGVTMEFGTGVVNDVKQVMIDGLKHCLKKDIASGHTLTTIFISSAFDSHQMPSRHMQQKAVDISRINGKKMAVHYSSDAVVKAIVNTIQEKFETFQHRRENFGPHLKKKLGENWSVSGHGDHIHFSVN